MGERSDDSTDGVDPEFVERLKAENKKYRKRAQDAEAKVEAFEPLFSLQDDDQQAVAAFADAIARGGQAGDLGHAAKMALEFSKALAGDGFDELIGVTPDDGGPDDDGADEPDVEDEMFSKDEMRQMVADAVAEAMTSTMSQAEKERAMHDRIAADLQDLGLSPDPTDPRTRLVLMEASANGGDLSAANDTVVSVIGEAGASDSDDDAAGAADTSAGADGEPDTTAPPEGQPTPGESSIPKTFAESESSALSKLDALAASGAFDD